MGPRPHRHPQRGVDSARLFTAAQPATVGARTRWTEPLGTYVLALGGIEPRKGSLDLLEAYDRLRRERPDVHLVFGGGETVFDYRAAFVARATELGVDVEVLGVIDDPDVPSLVAAAGALGFVSTKEGSDSPRWRRSPPGCPSSPATSRCCARSSGTR